MSFFIGDWNAKAGSQETPGVTGKFGLGVQNEAQQRLIEFCQENALVIAPQEVKHGIVCVPTAHLASAIPLSHVACVLPTPS